MRATIMTACVGAASFIGSYAMPLVFPHIESWIANDLLWLAGVLVVVSVTMYFSGRKAEEEETRASQMTHGGYSPALSGVFHGDVTVNSPPPVRPKPVASAPRRPMVISKSALREAAGLPALRPEIDLTTVTERVSRILGAQASDDRNINFAILDAVVQNGLAVWGRHGDSAIRTIRAYDLANAYLDCRAGTLCVPTEWASITYRDVKFSKSEVDGQWPE